jgi:hypothetical protein
MGISADFLNSPDVRVEEESLGYLPNRAGTIQGFSPLNIVEQFAPGRRSL